MRHGEDAEPLGQDFPDFASCFGQAELHRPLRDAKRPSRLRDGQVAVSGWTEQSGLDAFDFCARLQTLGIQTLICTDISRDGAMQGANHALYQKLSDEFSMNIIASGGVSSLKDIRVLRAMDLYGAIIGKAYYTGAIDLREAILAAEAPPAPKRQSSGQESI